MSSILSSQGAVVATAMVVSTTFLFLALSKQKTFPPSLLSGNQISQPPNKTPRSCLSSDGKRKKKNKRVQFADSVKITTGNGEKYRKEHESSSRIISKNEIPGIRRMPENRAALYNGILRDRVNRMQSSY